MDIINPATPLFNAIIFYILFITIIIIIKPKFLYSNKNDKFKSFGFGKGKTFCSLSIICLGSAICFYFIFLIIDLCFG